MSHASDTTLLAVIDSSGFEFNNNVLRKALKALVFEDFKVLDYNRMFSETLATIKERYVKGDDDSESVNGFFALTCAQVLLKLVKNISGKMRLREFRLHLVYWFITQ